MGFDFSSLINAGANIASQLTGSGDIYYGGPAPGQIPAPTVQPAMPSWLLPVLLIGGLVLLMREK